MRNYSFSGTQIEEGSPPKEPSSILYLFGFVGDSIVDGPGLRCVVFAQGCPHNCQGCHNPESHSFTGGTAYTPLELFERIQQFPLCKGVTFSGGEPFCQAEGFFQLAVLLKEAGYELAAYTGYTFEQLLKGSASQQQLLAKLDILIDSPFILAQRDLTLRFRGSQNQRILKLPESLQQKKPVFETANRWIGETQYL